MPLAEGREVEATFIESSGAGRTFEFHLRPLALEEGQPPGVIGLFHDITRLGEFGEHPPGIRGQREPANCAPPLTSIKASVETLIEDGSTDPSLNLRFLAIAKRQAERMEALLADLTDLSLIETGAIVLDPVMVDLSGLARDLQAQFGSLAEKAGVTLEFDLPRGVGGQSRPCGAWNEFWST